MIIGSSYALPRAASRCTWSSLTTSTTSLSFISIRLSNRRILAKANRTSYRFLSTSHFYNERFSSQRPSQCSTTRNTGITRKPNNGTGRRLCLNRFAEDGLSRCSDVSSQSWTCHGLVPHVHLRQVRCIASSARLVETAESDEDFEGHRWYDDHSLSNVDAFRLPIARIMHKSDGTPSYQLIVRQSPLSRQVNSSSGQTSSTVVHVAEVDVPLTKDNSTTRSKRAFLERQARDRRDVERSIRRPGPSWKILLDRLDASTPRRTEEGYSALVFGDADVLSELYLTLLSGPDQGVDPEPPVVKPETGNEMRLIGPLASLLRIQSDLGSGANSNESSTLRIELEQQPDGNSLPLPAKQSVSLRAKSLRKVTTTRLADQIPLPSVWTVKSLFEYVTLLTETRKAASISRPKHNKDRVWELLEEVLFKREDSRPALSYAAIHRAMQYLIEQRRTQSAAEYLQHMSNVGFPPVTQSFNILLSGCASEQNLAAFEFHMKQMLQHGSVPNDQTWFTLLCAVPSIDAKQAVARKMQRKGMNDGRTFAREESPTFIPFSFGPFLDSGGSSEQYITAIDKLFGTNWLNESAMTSIVDILARRGAFVEAIGVIDLFVERRGTLSSNSAIHILLGHLVTHCNLDLSIWLLVHGETKWRRRLKNHIVLELLFRLALRARVYNVARVVWLYAASSNELKPWMRREVLQSLEQSLKPELNTVQGRWKASFGAVVCRKDPVSSHEWTPTAILHRERTMLPLLRPWRPLISMLAEALVMDKEWAANNIKKTTTTEWKIRNAIILRFDRVAEDRLLESKS